MEFWQVRYEEFLARKIVYDDEERVTYHEDVFFYVLLWKQSAQILKGSHPRERLGT